MDGSSGTDGTAQGASEALRPARWFHLDGAERRGPLGLTVVRELVLDGTIGPETLVWADGMDDWLPTRLVPALVPPAALRATLTAWPEEAGPAQPPTARR